MVRGFNLECGYIMNNLPEWSTAEEHQVVDIDEKYDAAAETHHGVDVLSPEHLRLDFLARRQHPHRGVFESLRLFFCFL